MFIGMLTVSLTQDGSFALRICTNRALEIFKKIARSSKGMKVPSISQRYLSGFHSAVQTDVGINLARTV